MRVCVISPGVVHAVPRTLAIAAHIRDLHFLDITGTADTTALEPAGVRCHQASPAQNLAFQRLQKWLAGIAPDVIVCHYGSGDHFFGAVAYGRCPVAVIAMGHDVFYDRGGQPASRLRGWLVRMGMRRAAYVSAKSRALADVLRSWGVRGRVDVNFWGADLARFRPGDRRAARAILDLPADAAVILSPRAVYPTYNIHLIVQALVTVRARLPDARLVIVGRGDEAYLSGLRAQMSALGLEGAVQIRGPVAPDELVTWFQASDAVVSLSSSEGFPNTLLEAMGCAVPIVVGRLPQIRELLTDGVSARLCDYDVPAVAAALLDVLEHPEAAAARARAAREIALANGDLGVNAARFVEALREVCSGRSRAWPAPAGTGRFRLAYAAYLVTRAIRRRL